MVKKIILYSITALFLLLAMMSKPSLARGGCGDEAWYYYGNQCAILSQTQDLECTMTVGWHDGYSVLIFNFSSAGGVRWSEITHVCIFDAQTPF